MKKSLIIFIFVIIAVYFTANPFYYDFVGEIGIGMLEQFFAIAPIIILAIYPFIYFSIISYKLGKKNFKNDSFLDVFKIIFLGFSTIVIYLAYAFIFIFIKYFHDKFIFEPLGYIIKLQDIASSEYFFGLGIVMYYLSIVGISSFIIYGIVFWASSIKNKS